MFLFPYKKPYLDEPEKYNTANGLKSCTEGTEVSRRGAEKDTFQNISKIEPLGGRIMDDAIGSGGMIDCIVHLPEKLFLTTREEDADLFKAIKAKHVENNEKEKAEIIFSTVHRSNVPVEFPDSPQIQIMREFTETEKNKPETSGKAYPLYKKTTAKKLKERKHARCMK